MNARRFVPTLLVGVLLLPLVGAATPPGPVPGYPLTLKVCDSLACATASLAESIVECGPAGSGWWGTGGYWCRFNGEYGVASGLNCWSLSVAQPFADDQGSSSFSTSSCLDGNASFARTDWHFAPMTRTDTITTRFCVRAACSELAMQVTYTAD